MSSSGSIKQRGPEFEAVIQSFISELVVEERKFLLSLSPADIKEMVPDSEGVTPNMMAQRFRQHLSILFVVSGIAPSHLYWHESNIRVTDALATKVLQPLLKKHDILSYGFTLFKITKETLLQAEPGNVTSHWKDAWVFADIKSLKYQTVTMLFRADSVVCVIFNEYIGYQKALSVAGGNPVEYPVGEVEKYKFILVRYVDVTETHRLSGGALEALNAGRISVEYKMGADSVDAWMRCFQHWGRCQLAANKVGINLSFRHFGPPDNETSKACLEARMKFFGI